MATAVTGWNGTYVMRDVVVSANERLLVEHVAPGEVRILVNGVLISIVESWDYANPSTAFISLDPTQLEHYGLHIATGHKVTVTLEANRFAATRSWAAYQPKNR